MAIILTMQSDNTLSSDTSLGGGQRKKRLYIKSVILDFFYNVDDK